MQGWEIDLLILRPLELAASGAVPVMLLVLGMELARASSGIYRQSRVYTQLGLAMAMKLCIGPILAFGLIWILGLEGLIAGVVLLQSSMPTAVQAAILAARFNIRPELVTANILATTLGSIITLPFLLWMLQEGSMKRVLLP